MGAIRDQAAAVYSSGPATKPDNPDKANILNLFGAVDEAISGAAAGDIRAATWSALAAIPGTRAGQPGKVTGPDAGTHTDPVVGGTVSNTGDYAWSTSPAGWRRLRDLSTDADSVDLNQSKPYPLKSATRNGVASAASANLNNILLEMKVVGARPGFFYRVAYIQNGATRSGNTGFGWIIEEIDAVNYESVDNPATRIITYTDSAPVLDRSLTRQTIRLENKRFAGSIIITIDPSKLPNTGTAVPAESSGQAAYSWIIDPNCYVPINLGTRPDAIRGGVYYEINPSTKVCYLAFKVGSKLRRVQMQPNGTNSLFNIRQIYTAPMGDVTQATWTTVISTNTDFWPPLQVSANSGGDGGATAYSGGNHGKDGGTGGGTTARMVSWAAAIDGVPIEALASAGVVTGWAEVVSFSWVNRIKGYNTFSTDREIIEQCISAHVRAGSIESVVLYRALEAITVNLENGFQALFNAGSVYDGLGFGTSVHYLEGIAKARENLSGMPTAGTKAQAPEAWAAVMRGPAGDFVSWMDRGFGKGDLSSVGSTANVIRSSSDKIYHVSVGNNPLVLSTGQTFYYRGGYSWGTDELSGAQVDCGFVIHKNGVPSYVTALLGSGAGSVRTRVRDAGREISAGDRSMIDPDAAWAVSSSTGYKVITGQLA